MSEQQTEQTPQKLTLELVRWHRHATVEGRTADVQMYTMGSPCPCSLCETEVRRHWHFNNWILCDECWQQVDPKQSRHDKPNKRVKHYAPAYAFVYPILTEIARPLGYAITIHGSMDNDLDVVAIPWTEDAVSAEELLEELCSGCSVFFIRDKDGNYIDKSPGYGDNHRRLAALDMTDVVRKPHGRRAWNIQLGAGSRIDISVMPRSSEWTS